MENGWQVEQGYQQLKEELGLDHLEGHSWPGFHHHATLCFLAYVDLDWPTMARAVRLAANVYVLVWTGLMISRWKRRSSAS